MDVCLDCFNIVAIAKKCCSEHGSCMNLFELVFLFSLDEYPELELLYHMVVLFLIVLETSMLFSVVATPLLNSHQECTRVSFFHTFP